MLRNRRTTLLASLVAALALSALVFSAGAGAQRGGARQANQNAGAGQQKRVFVGRGSETRQGSRVTITADDTLKDYSAYRSGDRFYVVLPKSAAGGAARGGSGRGYSDMQVQQRGDSVVLSYRVQPGAKPRVEQKFNRLDVVFDVPEGAGQQQQQQQAAAGEANRDQQQQPPPAETRNQQPAAQQAGQTTAAPATTNPNNAAERAAAEAAANARNQAANNAAPVLTAPPVLTAEQPANVADPNAQPGATPSDAPAQEGANLPAEPQLAQAQPPAPQAPVSITKPATAADPAGTSLGAFLLRNWALTLIITLVVVGLGLVIAARRTTGATQEPAEGDAAGGASVAADEPRAARAREAAAAALKQASAAADAPIPAKASVPAETFVPGEAPVTAQASTLDAAETEDVDAKPFAAATALAGGAALAKSRKQSRKEARQDAKRKKKGARADSPLAEETLTAAPAAQEPVVAETVAEETVVEETVTEEIVVGEAAVETPTVEAIPVASEGASPAQQVEEAAQPEQTFEAPAFVVPPAEEVAEVSVAPEAGAAEQHEAAAAEPSLDTAEEATAETEAAPAVTEIAPVASEPFEPEVAETETVEAEAPAAVAEIEPAFAPEPERVSAETRSLLEGGAYDRAVIGTRDPVARQMIAAELLSALAGRNQQRRERAGAAFVEQGYFDETVRDLRSADAPAERAAAARSLALLGDRVATPHLIAALEDQNLDVRRAAVEALGSLRDPSAVGPLEALLERERNERNRIPPRVIRNAVETCRDAAAEAASAPPPVVAPAEQTRELVPLAATEAEPEAATEAATEPQAAAAGPETAPEAAHVAETAIEPAHVAEVESFDFEVGQRDASAAVEAAPAAESVLETETAAPAEAAAQEPAEESAVSLTPFVGEPELEPEPQAEPVSEAPAEPSNAIEPVFAGDLSAEEGEATLVAEAPAPEPEVDSFVADLTEELNAVAAESCGLETAVAEPQAVVETGLQPFAAPDDEYAVEVSEPAAARPSEEVGLEPFREHEPAAGAFTPQASESAQATLFEGGAAEESAESARGIAPFRPAEPETPAAGEWFDFDLREEPPAAAREHAPAPPPARGAVFESSSGETFNSQAGADANAAAPPPFFAGAAADEQTFAAPVRETPAPPYASEKGLALFDEHSTVPASIQQRLASREPSERAAAIVELSHVDTDEAFQQICSAFDDDSREVRGAAARALYELRADRAESFTRALREASPERRRQIGAAIATSGLAGESISQLTGESREKTYEAFSLLFLMAKAGEVQPLVRAIEGHPNNEVRLAVVKLLALSGQREILPAFRRLAVRGSLPTEVRSAVMEAIYQISSSQPTHAA